MRKSDSKAYYIDSEGNITPVNEMELTHLNNAYLKMLRLDEKPDLREELRKELQFRDSQMPKLNITFNGKRI
jgi:hypothetical protein